MSATAYGTLVEINAPLGTAITDSVTGTVTVALGSVSTASVFLAQIEGPLSTANVSNFGWNLSGTLSMATDSEGYALLYTYDGLDRMVKVLYPDGTTEQAVYDRRDAVLASDRLGRWSQASYDNLDQLVTQVDPQGRKTSYCWCECGSLAALTDALGHTTSWHHDTEGRVVEKVLADGSTINYAYEGCTRRLHSMTDAQSQVKTFAYNVDDSLLEKYYSSSVNATSNVAMAQDSVFPRSSSVSNGWGTYSYGYSSYGTLELYGTPTTNDYVNLLFSNLQLTTPHALQYQVKATDTSMSILASSIATAINADATLMGASISATASGSAITLSGLSPLNVGVNTAGVETITLSGTPTANSRVTVTINNANIVGIGSLTGTSNPYSGGGVSTIASQLASQLNDPYAGINVTSLSGVLTITPTTTQATTYASNLTANSGVTVTPSGGATESAYFVVSQPGGNRLASINNSAIPNSQITFSFDALGRTTNRSINGSANSTTLTYDAISRVTQEQNALGTFNYSYVDQSPTDKGTYRLSQVSYPNGQSAKFSYLPNIGDQRLQQIQNTVSSTVLSQANYAFDPAGQIKQWLQSQNGTKTHLSLGYDQASQLTGATSDTGSAINAYISGTPHAGDVVSVTAYDASLTGTTIPGQETATYTVQSGDTASTIASNLVHNGSSTGINDVMATNLGVSATASGAVIKIVQTSSTPIYCTQYTCAVSGSGATDTIALGSSYAVPNLHSQEYFNYDCAGNLNGVEGDTSGTSPNFTTTATQLSYNNVNELTATAAGGPVRFQGSYTNPVASSVVNLSQTLTVTGSITNGDVLSLSVHDKTRAQAQTFTYTVNSSVDTSTSLIASHFVTANSAALSAIGISASAASNVVTLTSTSTNATSNTASVSTGATETLTVGSSKAAVAVISPSNAILANPTFAGGASSTANTADVTAVSGGGTAATNAYSIAINGASPASLSYDANGNTLGDGTNTYSWDAENRLIKITYPGSGNNSQFTYDAMNRCVQIQETVGGTVTSTKQFVRCGAAMCEQRDGAGSLSNGKQFFGIGQVNFISGSGTSYFYERDMRGDIIGVTNSSGTEVASIKYDAYGKTTVLAGSFAPDFGFTGMYIHQASGLNLATFRAYNPNLGRWTSRDPIGENGGLNLYAYCHNNPISLVDSTGLSEVRPIEGNYFWNTYLVNPATGVATIVTNPTVRVFNPSDMSAYVIGGHEPTSGGLGMRQICGNSEKFPIKP